jgi:hypothetical protein
MKAEEPVQEPPNPYASSVFPSATLRFAAIVAAVAWLGIGRVATAQVGDPYYESQRKIIYEVLQGGGSKEVRQRKIVGLMDEFGKNRDLDSDMLAVFGCVLRDDSHALDAVLPRFAPFFPKSDDQRELGRFLEMLIKAADVPPAIVSKADAVFRRKTRSPYAKPRAAAIVLKAHPERTDLLQWFDAQLAATNETEKLNAAYAIGWAGKAATPESKNLAGLMKDSDSTIRVISAEAYWRVTHDPAGGVPVLRAALHDRPRELDLFFRYASEQSGWTQTSEAVRCLGDMGKNAAPAADDIASFALKSNEIDPISSKYGFMNKIEPWCVVYSIKALSKIGARSATITAALEKLSRDDDPEIADAAKAAIEKLR